MITDDLQLQSHIAIAFTELTTGWPFEWKKVEQSIKKNMGWLLLTCPVTRIQLISTAEIVRSHVTMFIWYDLIQWIDIPSYWVWNVQSQAQIFVVQNSKRFAEFA